jgi:O-antigen biosynthesis protein
MSNGQNGAMGEVGLRDGWILTGSVLVPLAIDSIEVSVVVDGVVAGRAVASVPLGGPTENGLQRVGFEYVPRFLLDRGQPHLLECFDSWGRLIGRLSTSLRQAKPYHDPSTFLAWAYYHRLMRAPFSDHDEICLSYFDWYATHCATRAAAMPARLVTIVMPYFNCADTLPRAIESVLAQTHVAWQLIVVDDGSDEPLGDLYPGYRDPRVTVFRLPSNRGQAAARNAALSLAESGLIAFLDADNYWDPRFLAVMAAALEANPDRDMAYCGQYLRQDSSGAPVAVRMGDFNPSLIENENYIDLNCTMIRKQALDRVGRFDEALGALEDWELFLRLIDEKAPIFVPVVLSHYTFDRSTSVTRSAKVATSSMMLMSKRRSQNGVRTFTAVIDGQTETFWSTSAPAVRPQRSVSIIIPSYGIGPVLRVCIEQVFATVDAEHAEVIVCDNGSDADTLAELVRLEARYPTLRVDRVHRNNGFTHAVNRGLRLAAPENDVVILNNDAIVTAGWLDALLDVRLRHLDAGIVVPRQVLLPRTHTISNHTPYANPDHEIDVTLSAHHRNVDCSAPVGADGTTDLTFVPFFCALITREALTAIGFLDERLGRHYRSDSIFCFALRDVAKLRILFAPRSKVYHLLQRATRALRRSDNDGFRRMLIDNQWDDQESSHPSLPWRA